MIRFICVVVFLILFLILTIPVFFIEWLIGKFNRNARDYSCLRIVQWGFKAILKVTGVHTTVIGFENIPDEPVLFIGNHRSFFDILLTYSRCPRLTGYVAKKEMEKIPLLSTWMRFVYCLFLDRKNPKEHHSTATSISTNTLLQRLRKSSRFIPRILASALKSSSSSSSFS